MAPACFEAFAAGRELAPATVRNCVGRLGRHRVRASRAGAANLLRAVLADGSRVEGLVFPGALIWDDDPPPRRTPSRSPSAGDLPLPGATCVRPAGRPGTGSYTRPQRLTCLT